MGTFYRQVNLTTKGNKAFVAADQDVISQVDGQTYLPFENGRLIAYDPFTGKTLDAAGVATARGVKFGVGYNSNKNALLATHIRHAGGNDIDLCKSSIKIDVSAPQCPSPQVIDLEIGGCMLTGTDYMVDLAIKDALTRSYFKEGAAGSILINLREDLAGCNNCSEEDACSTLACQLAAKINNKYIQHFPNTSKLGLNTGMPGNGIWAVQKFVNTRTFSLAASAVEGSACAVKGLKSITATDLGTLTFTNVVDPSAPTQTLLEQLSSVISQINAFLTGKGSAYLKPVDCCTYEIEINSCILDAGTITMAYHDDAAVSNTTAAAFTAFTEDEMCAGCTTPSSVTNTCGVRIFVDPIELPCNCAYPDGNPPSYLGRSVTITAWGDGWSKTAFRVKEVEAMVIPRGTGYEVQQDELKQSNGGEGFDYAHSHFYTDGRIPLPAAGFGVNDASVADCNDLYCRWSVVIANQVVGSPHARNVQNSQSFTLINVPKGDQDTIDALEEFLTALAERGFCSSATIECLPASS